MSTAATISIQLEAQTAQLKQGFHETRQSIDKLGAGMSGSVAAGMAKFHAGLLLVQGALASVRGLIDGVRESMAGMADTGDTADRIGIGTGALQALRYAAEQTAGSAGAMDAALLKMSIKIADAAKNGGEMAKTLASMGLNAQALAAMPVDQQVLAVADAIKAMNSEGEQNAALMKLMEEGGLQLAATFRGGSEALLELTAQARDNGLASDEMIRMSQQGQAAVLRLSAAWTTFKNVLAAYVVPAILKVVEGLTWLISKMSSLFGITAKDDPLKPLSDSARKATADVTDLAVATEKSDKKLKEVAKKTVDLKKEIDSVKLESTQGIGAVTRSSAAGFSAVQQANRDAQDADRRHKEQLRVLEGILAAVARGDVVLAPVRI